MQSLAKQALEFALQLILGFGLDLILLLVQLGFGHFGDQIAQFKLVG